MGPPRTSPHQLLTALGRHPRTVRYGLGGATHETFCAPLALLALLPPHERPDGVLCLTTPPVVREGHFQAFEDKARELGVRVEPVAVGERGDPESVRDLLERVAERIEPRSRLTLDITHGLRHIPFVFYALGLYLSGLRGVRIEGVWYGMLESAEDVKPLHDLKPLLDLPLWFHAVLLFKDAGDARALAARLKAVRASLPEGPQRGPPGEMASLFDRFTAAYASALPLEAGFLADAFAERIAKTPLAGLSGLDIPLREALQERLSDAVKDLRLKEPRASGGRAPKAGVVLDEQELRRQARLIDQYLERGRLPQALGLMREWVVSLAVLRRGDPSRWLERSAREAVQGELGALLNLQRRGGLSEDTREWIEFWDKLTKRRNGLAHHGMLPETVKLETDGLGDLKEFWDRVKERLEIWPPLGGGRGSLLLTPLGMSPGVLYSALRATSPDRVLVVCTAQTRPSVADACRRASFPEERVREIAMRDPNAFEEVREIVPEARDTYLEASRLLVNLTGGTTMMGLCIQQIYEQARKDGRRARRFVLLDTRPPERQRQDPWVESEIRWLDPEDDAVEGGAE